MFKSEKALESFRVYALKRVKPLEDQMTWRESLGASHEYRRGSHPTPLELGEILWLKKL